MPVFGRPTQSICCVIWLARSDDKSRIKLQTQYVGIEVQTFQQIGRIPVVIVAVMEFCAESAESAVGGWHLLKNVSQCAMIVSDRAG
jgi:hypothetical protein